MYLTQGLKRSAQIKRDATSTCILGPDGQERRRTWSETKARVAKLAGAMQSGNRRGDANRGAAARVLADIAAGLWAKKGEPEDRRSAAATKQRAAAAGPRAPRAGRGPSGSARRGDRD